MKFDELLESEDVLLNESYDETLMDFIADSYDEDEVSELAEDFDLSLEEATDILESLKKRVSSTGKVSRVQSRKKRSRRANKTTGLSKAKRKMRARKAAKTRKKNTSGMKKAVRKRAKAMKKRKRMGL